MCFWSCDVSKKLVLKELLVILLMSRGCPYVCLPNLQLFTEPQLHARHPGGCWDSAETKAVSFSLIELTFWWGWMDNRNTEVKSNRVEWLGHLMVLYSQTSSPRLQEPRSFRSPRPTGSV